MSHCGSFWATLELLVSIRGKNDLNSQLFNEEIEDWVDNFCDFLSSHQEENTEEEKEKSPIDYNLIECK